MHQLVKIEGTNPERITVIGKPSKNQTKLEAQRDELMREAFAGMGPGSMKLLRYAVREISPAQRAQ